MPKNDCIILLLTVITLGIMLCEFSLFTLQPHAEEGSRLSANVTSHHRDNRAAIIPHFDFSGSLLPAHPRNCFQFTRSTLVIDFLCPAALILVTENAIGQRMEKRRTSTSKLTIETEINQKAPRFTLPSDIYKRISQFNSSLSKSISRKRETLTLSPNRYFHKQHFLVSFSIQTNCQYRIKSIQLETRACIAQVARGYFVKKPFAIKQKEKGKLFPSHVRREIHEIAFVVSSLVSCYEFATILFSISVYQHSSGEDRRKARKNIERKSERNVLQNDI